MITRIATLATLMALAGCVTAESHEPSEETTTVEGQLTEADVLGRWEARASGEVIELIAGGVYHHEPVVGQPHGGSWHLTDFAGSQYLVTVFGATGAQRIGVKTAATLELSPGGVYDTVTQ